MASTKLKTPAMLLQDATGKSVALSVSARRPLRDVVCTWTLLEHQRYSHPPLSTAQWPAQPDQRS